MLYKMPLPILTEIKDRNHFAELLQSNPGALIIKFGAEWCGPCKLIEKQVTAWMNIMPEHVQCAIIDVDESFDVYAFLKSKKMVKGIPAILVYKKGTLTYVPDDIVIGADVGEIDALFRRICG